MALALSWWKRARGAFSRQERAQSTATSEELRLDPLSVGLPNVESPNIGPPNVGPLNVVPSNFDPSNGAELRPGLTANEVLDKDGSSISVLRRLLHRSWFSPHSRTLAWETLTRGLEVLKDATPFCPPVQSVAGGLLQLIYQCDAIAHNPAERRKLYACVNTIKDHLDVARRSLDRHPITESGQAVKASVEAFDSVLQDVLRDAKAQALGSQGRFKRFKRHAQVFILARFHKAQISDLLSRLFEADAHLRRALEIDTNHTVHQLELSADHLATEMDSMTSLHRDASHSLHDFQRMESANHDLVRHLLQTINTNVQRVFMSSLVGLFVVARS